MPIPAIATAMAPVRVGAHVEVCRRAAARRRQQLQRHAYPLLRRIRIRAHASRSLPARTRSFCRLEAQMKPFWERDGVLGPIRLEAFSERLQGCQAATRRFWRHSITHSGPAGHAARDVVAHVRFGDVCKFGLHD